MLSILYNKIFKKSALLFQNLYNQTTFFHHRQAGIDRYGFDCREAIPSELQKQVCDRSETGAEVFQKHRRTFEQDSGGPGESGGIPFRSPLCRPTAQGYGSGL